jgi:hypothetical protein
MLTMTQRMPPQGAARGLFDAIRRKDVVGLFVEEPGRLDLHGAHGGALFTVQFLRLQAAQSVGARLQSARQVARLGHFWFEFSSSCCIGLLDPCKPRASDLEHIAAPDVSWTLEWWPQSSAAAFRMANLMIQID